MSTKCVSSTHEDMFIDNHDLSVFHRRDLFLHLLPYLKMREICYILTINQQLNEWINYYATHIRRYFGLPLDSLSDRSLWLSIHHLMSESVQYSKPYIIHNIDHKENIYFMSYKAPYLVLVSWDHSFTILSIQQTQSNPQNTYNPNKPTSIQLNIVSTFGANNCHNYFGANKEKLFKFNTWEQFYSIDFLCYHNKLYIAFGGNINLYLAIFDLATNRYEIVTHAFEEPQEFNHVQNHQSNDNNQHWIRTCKMAPKCICDLELNGYILIISGHGYDGEVVGVLAVNKECRIVYQDIIRVRGYVGCALQTRAIEFYYDKEHDIKLLIVAVVYDDTWNVLMVYNITCLKYKVELQLLDKIENEEAFGGAIAMRNDYLVTTGEGTMICLWKINKDNLYEAVKCNDDKTKRRNLSQKVFTLIAEYDFFIFNKLLGFINEIDFFHDDFFVVCGSAGAVVMLYIDEAKLNVIKTWISKKDGFWSICNANNYILCGNEDGKLCSYSF